MAEDNVGRIVNGQVVRPKRQLAMVFDLNKCLGCQTCTIACKTLWTREEGMEHMWWSIVNTMPGRGTPKDWEDDGRRLSTNGAPRAGRLPTSEEFGEAWEFNYDEVFYGGKGRRRRTCASRKPPTGAPNWDEDQGGGEYPNSYYFYLPRICNHCTHPACLEACPRQAIYKREEDGIVLIDEERCNGYRFCMEACPYKKIYFNHDAHDRPEVHPLLPAHRAGRGTGVRATVPRPRCASSATSTTRRAPIHKLVKQWKVALPLARGARHGAERLLRAAALPGPTRCGRRRRRVQAANPDRVPAIRSSAPTSTARSRCSRPRWRRRSAARSPTSSTR